MNNAKECRPAATRAATRVFADTITRLGEARGKAAGYTDGMMCLETSDVEEAARVANRVFKSRRAGLAGRKTRRQQRG